MSDAATKRMLAPFVEEAPAPTFLASWFKSPPENYHNSETVELDIERDGEDVAVVVTGGPGNGQNENEDSLFSNKELTPPEYDEVLTIKASKLLKRNPGENPFADPNYQASAILRTFKGFRKLQAKIRRGIEVMASQVLQTGQLTLINKAGVTAYTLDFSPKSAHFAAVGTAWSADGQTGDPMADIQARAAVVRANGHRSPDTLIFGDTAWTRFLIHPKVIAALSRDGLGLGALDGKDEPEDATFQGFIRIGSYKYKMYTYSARYNHIQTGVSTPYVGDERVIMLSSKARLDLSFGRIPILMPEKRALDALPPRIMDSARGIDLTVHSWLEDGGKFLKVSAGTRPLTIPTEIDSFACLDITP